MSAFSKVRSFTHLVLGQGSFFFCSVARIQSGTAEVEAQVASIAACIVGSLIFLLAIAHRSVNQAQ